MDRSEQVTNTAKISAERLLSFIDHNLAVLAPQNPESLYSRTINLSLFCDGRIQELKAAWDALTLLIQQSPSSTGTETPAPVISDQHRTEFKEIEPKKNAFLATRLLKIEAFKTSVRALFEDPFPVERDSMVNIRYYEEYKKKCERAIKDAQEITEDLDKALTTIANLLSRINALHTAITTGADEPPVINKLAASSVEVDTVAVRSPGEIPEPTSEPDALFSPATAIPVSSTTRQTRALVFSTSTNPNLDPSHSETSPESSLAKQAP